MKVAVIYYSFSGNTRNMCEFISEELNKKGYPTASIVLKPKKETTSFFSQGREAFLRREIELLDIEAIRDISSYDFVIFASPVWAFTITPAMRSYLKKVQGLKEKKCLALLTAGSIKGAGKVLREFVLLITARGGKVWFKKALKGNHTKDKGYLREKLTPALELILEKGINAPVA